MGALHGDEGIPLDLRAAIAKRGFTTTTFAVAVGVSPRLVAYWLRAERQPSRDMAVRIAHVLGLSPLRVLPNFVIRKNRSPAPRLYAPYDPSLPLLGNNLRAARKRLGMRQCDLAAAIGCEPQWISLAERGDADSAVLTRMQNELTQRLSALASPARRRGRPRKVVTP